VLKLIAHRGLWRDSGLTQNSLAALLAASNAGYSIETDVRSYQGQLIISHDPLTSNTSNCLLLSDLLLHLPPEAKLFLNVKEDGLLPMLASLEPRLSEFEHYFFDMSFPELVKYQGGKMSVLNRVSLLEPIHANTLRSAGWWVDCFSPTDSSYARMLRDLSNWKCGLVSPDLHGLPHLPTWDLIRQLDSSDSEWYLCTDLVEEARAHFLSEVEI
jgi:hypothetical protein